MAGVGRCEKSREAGRRSRDAAIEEVDEATEAEEREYVSDSSGEEEL